MALLDKGDTASVLGLEESDIETSLYDWSKKQFFMITDLRESEEQKTYRKFISRHTNLIKLPDRDIKSIDDIKRDGESVDSLTQHENLKFNPDTGLLWYSGGFGHAGVRTVDGKILSCGKDGGFSSGQLVEIEYTINAYTHQKIHDYLLVLLVAKALSLFTPEKVKQVKSVKIGNYTKKFGSASSNLEKYQMDLEKEIDRIVDVINGNDGRMRMDWIA